MIKVFMLLGVVTGQYPVFSHNPSNPSDYSPATTQYSTIINHVEILNKFPTLAECVTAAKSGGLSAQEPGGFVVGTYCTEAYTPN